ncbi:ABC transporter permease [Clostridium beijerinckii]|uniref:ABC transporter permease n=1 Tax=Clostridium beijerinckii TaxID=1520 RepID=A0AAW3WGR0_CLOBE|nr:ABC transporter permease [Clostridium beijerinckii]MBC2460451.1 ABC transporter permease [Clostridium beijerinckii]MBC2477921.1 ABC transporter permease [Clostridium beijerinckii]NOV59767.1 ABC-2 type transport system permease protein [Clostridium beijerinckii]NOV71449.1 ABC-2 type transport system permease protein [Clostridium beijerinckii]NOW34375.1 ABC-2 type transport system permease protein [Clostridium beijerinckii]
MIKIYYLFKVSMEKAIKELSRYKFNTLSDILSFYVLFIAMFTGIKVFGESMKVSSVSFGNTIEGFIAGYFMWNIMVLAYSDTANNIVSDANRGTLEQLNMSDLGLSSILVVRSLCNILISVLISFILLFLIMITTQRWLNINFVSMLIPIFIGIFSILGISLIFGGLALIFKSIKSLLNIIQYFLIGLVLPAPENLNHLISIIVPFRPSIDAVYKIMINGDSVADFSIIDFGIMITNSIIYFTIGLFIFNQCSKVAKKRALLGQY